VRYEVLNSRENKEGPHVIHGPTRFSDLSPQQFKDLYLMKNFNPRKEATVGDWEKGRRRGRLGSYPSSWSWVSKGDVTNVNDQGQCGDPYIFSAIENIETECAIKSGKMIPLSAQQVLDCDTQIQGCDGGYPDQVYDYVISCGGLESAATYPNSSHQERCKFNSSDVVAKISKWFWVTKTKNESAIQEYVYTSGAPSVCLDATAWATYQGGVLTSKTCPGSDVNHCAQITGWEVMQGVSAWAVRNSWGTDWGDEGYVYLQMGQNTCGIADYCQSCDCTS